ncbi:PfkB family carbohydrate kinase [Mucilaginibacter sp. 3215]|uniref:PfkB family carbohydrate kinase n=1 Tax=Mucilaginibacter sp. 3215 TaxID=3373912 RepID=UPI003D225418
MIGHASYRVFDVNLRTPHYSVGTITDLLNHADLVNLNAVELLIIANWHDAACEIESDCVDLLFSRFGVKEVLITKGGTGATYHTPMFRYDYPAYKINVADTIGSGDSFLAALRLAVSVFCRVVNIHLWLSISVLISARFNFFTSA